MAMAIIFLLLCWVGGIRRVRKSDYLPDTVVMLVERRFRYKGARLRYKGAGLRW